MPTCRALLAMAVLVACGRGGAHHGDGGTGGPSGPDAPLDGWVPDTRPPMLVTTTPGSDTWLEEPVRLVFDEALDPASLDLAVTAQLAGTPVATHVALDWDKKAVMITLDPAVRGLGALDLHVEGTVADVAGNKAPVTSDVNLTVAPWSAPPAIDLGTASSSPAVAIDGRGAVLAAWTVGAPGSRQLVVAQLYGGLWAPAGAPLGSSDVSSPTLVIDAAQRPVVGWIEGGTAHTARWDSGVWTPLPSPGTGSVIALATAPGGDPVAAVFGTTAAVFALVSDAWQPIGATIPTGTLVGEPALAVGSTGHPAVGWIADNTVHVVRFDSAWTSLAPIALPAPPSGIDHMSLAMRGAELVVAYDAWAGSFGVLAAKASGAATTWTRLDHLLDLDAQSDAIAPVVAIGPTGAPVVAWTEMVDGMRERGLIAQWSGSKWLMVGGTPWLTDPHSAPARPTLALHGGGAPVVGWAADGRLGVARFNGPASPPIGIATRASIAGCAFNAASPPAQLLSTGCFTVTTAGQPTAHPGLVPYDIVVKLWTDGAYKRRWIALPDGGTMTTSATGAWNPPVGTFIIKEFAYERTPGSPGTRRAMETRILAKTASGWQGFSYQWNTAGTNAALLTDGEWTYDWPLDNGSTHRHLYPSRSECTSCHESSYGPLLGLRSPQLARWVDYDGHIADQLATLAHLGVGPGASATPFVSPHDASETWERRMRGYMAANCAHCHNPDHIAVHDLRYTTPLAQTNLCPDIVPGDPAASKTYQLVSSRPGMPPLGTLATDPLAIQTLGNWISGMQSCP